MLLVFSFMIIVFFVVTLSHDPFSLAHRCFVVEEVRRSFSLRQSLLRGLSKNMRGARFHSRFFIPYFSSKLSKKMINWWINASIVLAKARDHLWFTTPCGQRFRDGQGAWLCWYYSHPRLGFLLDQNSQFNLFLLARLRGFYGARNHVMWFRNCKLSDAWQNIDDNHTYCMLWRIKFFGRIREAERISGQGNEVSRSKRSSNANKIASYSRSEFVWNLQNEFFSSI